MKHLDRIHEIDDQHSNPIVCINPTGLSSISVFEGRFVHVPVMEVTIRGHDGSYSRSFLNAIPQEYIK